MDKLTLKTDHKVVVQVELAPLSTRLGAVFVDLVIMVIYVVFMTYIIDAIFVHDFQKGEAMYQFWLAFFYCIVYLPFILYSPICEYFTKGQTIGKMIFNLRVVKSNGENADFKSYFLRWLFRPIELAEKIAHKLVLDLPQKGRQKFLNQILQDYIVLTR